MTLEILPTRTGGAAENMAVDFLLLQRYPQASAPRFRHYDWRAPAFTFGYAQKIAFVRAALPVGERFDLCRRPTGGGIVDHREDWTYALVIPRGHALEEARAAVSYRLIHEALAEALREQGVDAITQATPPDPSDESAASGACFDRAEIHDVILAPTQTKIAGAAQKRNKHGLLFQGSVWKPATGREVNWDAFEQTFVEGLGRVLGLETQSVPWPEFHEDEVEGLTEQYSAPEWIEHR